MEIKKTISSNVILDLVKIYRKKIKDYEKELETSTIVLSEIIMARDILAGVVRDLLKIIKL